MIRLYKPNGQILIDGKHKNIALVQKVTLSAEYMQRHRGNLPMQVSFDHLGVVVLPIANSQSSAIGLWVTHNISGRARALISVSVQHAINTFYLFGNPATAVTTGLAGLRIYSETTGELIFDSRLKYLKILGYAQNDLLLDPSKQYGLLYTRSPAHTTYGNGYYESYTGSYEHDTSARYFYWRDGNTLRGFGDVPSNVLTATQPPLLVDLTGL